MPTYIRNGRIFVKFAYNVDTLAKIKAIPDRTYHPDSKEWSVPATIFHAKHLLALNDVISVGPEVSRLTQQITGEDVITSYSRKRERLYPFQSTAVEFGHQCQGRFLIGDEPGLGKTVESLTFVEEKRYRWVLVVAPASVVSKWGQEILTWTSATPWVIKDSKQRLPDKPSYHVISYDLMTRMFDALKTVPYECIIFDECHKIKNPKALRTKAAKKLAKGKSIIGLSGTPLINKPIELWTILNMIAPSTYSNWYIYANRYCLDIDTGYYTGAAHLDELAEKLKSIMIRRLKTDVLDQLPALRRIVLPVDINLSLYNRVMREYPATMQEMFGKETFDNPLDKLTALRHIIGREKAAYAVEWVQDLLDSCAGKVVLYCKHLDVCKFLAEKLSSYGVLSITGDVQARHRQERIDLWQSNNTYRIMIITSAGGEGINLFGLNGVDSSRILFVEREWTPAAEEQAEARLHRIGQTSSAVEAYYLLARGTIDETVHKLIDRKRGIVKSVIVMDEPETIIQDLLREELDI